MERERWLPVTSYQSLGMIERGTMHCAIIEGGHLQYHASARLDTWGPQEPHEGPERWQKSLAGSCSSHPSHHICTSHHEFMHLTHHPVPRDPPFPNNQPPRSLVHCGVSVSKCYSKVSFGCKEAIVIAHRPPEQKHYIPEDNVGDDVHLRLDASERATEHESPELGP
ncbi:hypothetical protein TWF102_002698 [Orbilia oligospora]|uniref:Uncharacterized protein n=1 Tax=Orbilia oligospora TaxID=2813651 RepID=A0A7C8JNZ2_ORBOL|nr:hypothetical protein TWF102_002698 [Orbilia oligospora]KAF3116147.1 hypothetical protein TWF103_009373 [Orbilia oligospora]